MKFKNLIPAILFVLINYSTIAQKEYYKVRVGKPIKYPVIIGANDDETYVIETIDKNRSLSVFNPAMKKLRSISLEKILNQNEYLFGAIVGNQLMLVSLNKTETGVYIHALNNQTLLPDKEQLLIDLTSFESKSKDDFYYDFQVLKPFSKLMVNVASKGKFKSVFKFIDQDFNISDLIQFEGDFDRFDLYDYHTAFISNDVIYIFLEFNNPVKYIIGKSTKWKMYKLTPNENPFEIELPIYEDKKNAIRLISLSNDDILLYGFDKIKSNNYAFFSILLNDKRVVKENKWEPDFNFLTFGKSKKEKEKFKSKYEKGKFINSFVYLKPVFLENQEVILVGQILSEWEDKAFWGSISVYKLDYSGKVVWAKKVISSQRKSNSGLNSWPTFWQINNQYHIPFQGFGSVIDGKNLLLVFNENDDNPNENVTEGVESFHFQKKAKLAMAKIDLTTGKIQKKIIFSSDKMKQYDVIPDPSVITPVGDKTYFFAGYKGLRKGGKLMKFYIEIQ